MQPGMGYAGASGARDDEYGPAAAPVAPARKPVRRGRIGLLLLTAFLTEVIAIAAAANQSVINKLERTNADPQAIKGGFERALETYGWRFAPRTHDIFHVWAGGLALIGTTVVLSLLLIFAVVRGPLTFGRAFFGSWLAVAAATMVGGYVRGLVIDTPAYSRQGIPARVLFSDIAPGSTTFLAGVALGLIVGILVAVVGVATRRPAETIIAEPGVPLDGEPTPRYADDRYPDDRYADDTYAYPREYAEPAGGRVGYGTADNPMRGVPWQEGRYGPSTGSGVTEQRGFEQREYEQRADSTDTTALPAMRPADADTDRERTAALRDAAPGTAEPGNGKPGNADSPTAQSRTVEPAMAESAGQQPVSREAPQPEPVQQEPVQQETPRQNSGNEPGAAMSSQQATSSQQTTQFPRPPDDEDLDLDHH